MSEPLPLHFIESIATNGSPGEIMTEVQRMAVPGGWLYSAFMVTPMGPSVSTTFVADPDLKLMPEDMSKRLMLRPLLVHVEKGVWVDPTGVAEMKWVKRRTGQDTLRLFLEMRLKDVGGQQITVEHSPDHGTDCWALRHALLQANPEIRAPEIG